MLSEFTFYDLFITSFVQLLVGTVLVFSPLRDIDRRLRWFGGSRIGDLVLGAIGSAGVAAVSAILGVWLWGLNARGAETAAYLLALFSMLVVMVRRNVSVIGRVFWAAYAAAGVTFLGFAAVVALNATRNIGETITATILMVLSFGALMVWNSNVNYVTDVMCRTNRGRPFPVPDPSYQPFVSLHLPAYNEPPELLIETIKHVEAIDYPNFEIVVIDNNTVDPAIWEPVEEYCRSRDRIKFIHVAPWPGYKAGACNLVLRQHTDPRAEIIGLIDADDIVQPHYLKETVPYFGDETIGFVQTFEGNRGYEGSDYYQACVDSYQGFYVAIMSSRNERDSVPFVGTMGLFRRRALEGAGGWNEWCISEDTEASLRVLKQGWSGLYLPRCFGRGVVPPTFGGLNTQRHRWCFGGMQILRLHWRSLMPWDRSPDNHLTPAQRRDYLAGALSWFRDPLMFGFSLMLLVIAGLLVTDADFALAPLRGQASLLPMSLILIATIAMTWTLRHCTNMTRRRALKALTVSLSASWVTALAVFQGLTYREGKFLRTSKKGADAHPWRTAFRLSRVETVLAASLFGAAAALLVAGKRPLLLLLVLVVQGLVYACSPITAIWNNRAQRVPRHEYRRRFEQAMSRRARRRVPAFATFGFTMGVLAAVAAGALVAVYAAPQRLAPVPAATVAQELAGR